MKPFLILLLGCLTCVGQPFQITDRALLGSLNAPAATTPATYIIWEGFEEADTGGDLGSATDGYDSPLVNFEGGAPNNKFTPALEGGYSLSMTNGDRVRFGEATQTATSNYFFCKIKVPVLPAATRTILGAETGSAAVWRVQVMATGALRFYHGDQVIATTGTIIAGGQYNIWAYWNTNGNGWIEWQTNGVGKVGSGDNYNSLANGDGNSGAAVKWFWDLDGQDIGFIMDRFCVSSNSIADVPTPP